MKRCNVLSTHFSFLSYEDVLAALWNWRQNGEHHYVTLTPPYSVLLCRYDSELRQATDGAALTLPDGVGIILAAKLLGYPHCGRVTGPSLMLRLCDWGRKPGLGHFFCGGAPGIAEALARRLTTRFPGLTVAGTYCPPFRELTPTEDEEMVRQINEAKPDIVWVGLGSPKQEKWMATHVGRISAPVMIGVGAAFDFHSGRTKRAPEWMQKIGIEWVYRFAREPKRMWRRNVNSFVFLAGVLVQCLRRWHGRHRAVPESEHTTTQHA